MRPENEHGPRSGSWMHDSFNGARIGAIVGALLGAILTVITTPGLAWMILAGAALGGTIGWVCEQHRTRSECYGEPDDE